ncbi:MAG TPA: hypothetical protein VEQ58_09095, partial [Polyangiaceae bacterium]|nr:hypothetical protein [Polyangiaceae bacterium]
MQLSKLEASVAERTPRRQALAGLRAELLTIQSSDLFPVNHRMTRAVRIMLDMIPRVTPLLPEFTKHTPTIDQSLMTKLPTYAAACLAADQAWKMARLLPSTRQALLPVARRQRRELLAVFASLAARGLIDPAVYCIVSDTKSYQGLANDLGFLAEALRSLPTGLADEGIPTHDELDAVDHLALRLLAEPANLSHDLRVRDAADLRSRAYTLALRAYNEIRHAVVYIRWRHGDADALIPALYDGRPPKWGKSRRGSRES